MSREAQLGIASGEKGCGKTYTTLNVQIRNALSGGNGKYKPKKVLIFDVNNEYGDVQKDHKNPNFPSIKGLDVDELSRWIKQPLVEARRISVMKPKDKGGGKMNHKELQECLSQILTVYRNGLLIVEDLTNYVSDTLPSDLVGTIISQRHVSVDVIIHFQSIGKAAHPKLWANCNWFRFHKTGDTVLKNELKLAGVNLTPLYIAEKMIEHQERLGNKKNFCVYYHKNTKGHLVGKIQGRFNLAMFKKGIESYLEDNIKIVQKEEKRESLYTGVKIHASRKQAVDFLIKEYTRLYYGNADFEGSNSRTAKKIARPHLGKKSEQTVVSYTEQN